LKRLFETLASDEGQSVSHDPTKVRLLEAAGEEFASKGFDGATVRAICDRAGTNLAAVNYHFGDKEHLYEQTVLHAHRCGPSMPDEVAEDGLPEAALRQHIGHFLSNVVALQGPTWHQILMLREMVNPSGASEALVREAIRPRFERLTRIIRRLCPNVEEPRIHAIAFSVVGQCLHYKLTRPISERLIGAEAFAAMDVEFLTDHISRFTLAALGHEPPFDSSVIEAKAVSRKGTMG
jgi:TetR/AcrR family transcriptional regulator, regulator of cefoperazone and chloramphenicol sensitivity